MGQYLQTAREIVRMGKLCRRDPTGAEERIFVLAVRRGDEVPMSNFSWILEIPTTDWPEPLRGKRYVRMPLRPQAARTVRPALKPNATLFHSERTLQRIRECVAAAKPGPSMTTVEHAECE